jgi:hypothetical protein
MVLDIYGIGVWYMAAGVHALDSAQMSINICCKTWNFGCARLAIFHNLLDVSSHTPTKGCFELFISPSLHSVYYTVI